MFEVIRGQQFDGTVAIDDLYLTNGLCPVVNASCDFERGLGDFIQDNTDDLNWYLQRYNTPSYSTGPTYDHTLGPGRHGKIINHTSSFDNSRVLEPRHDNE